MILTNSTRNKQQASTFNHLFLSYYLFVITTPFFLSHIDGYTVSQSHKLIQKLIAGCYINLGLAQQRSLKMKNQDKWEREREVKQIRWRMTYGWVIWSILQLANLTYCMIKSLWILIHRYRMTHVVSFMRSIKIMVNNYKTTCRNKTF